MGPDHCHGWARPSPWYSPPTSILSHAAQTHPECLSTISFNIISLPTPFPSGPFLCRSSTASLPLLFNPSVSDPCSLTSASFLLSLPQSLHMTFAPCPVMLVLPPDPTSLPPAGGLTEEELMEQLEQCDLAPLASSRGSLPSPSPRTSLTR